MVETPKQDGSAAGAPPKDGAAAGGSGARPEAKAPPKQNPVFKMMGLPNFRWRLPSRNWMIFLTVVGSWTTAVVYDRREKKRIQKKWCDLVSDIAQQTVNTRELPRTINVILAAPPGDSLAASQIYFKEYVKPVLVAAALEYDLIQGRREGDVRYGVAEQIRRLRRKKGEKGDAKQEGEEEPQPDTEQLLDAFRQMTGVYAAPGVKAYIPTSAYSSAQLSPYTPNILEPSQPFHQYHLLGFLKTPIRMWHFLNQRKLADECGRQAAAVVLAAYRPYHESQADDSLTSSSPSSEQTHHQSWEQQTVNEVDELTWVKSVRKPKKIDESKERIWMADVVLDQRIASRMRRFELDPEEEARAARIGEGKEQGRAVQPIDLEKQQSIVGNLDDADA
ncbi:hypothetical protein DV738_g3465, partial [Chaetothyriales sp. CBS 135597]